MERTVAVLGTGTMGTPMVRNLLEHGFAVRVWNRTRARTATLAAAGAVPCATPSDAASGAVFVITMLADAAVTELVMTEPAGALPAMSANSIWLQMGTVGADACHRMSVLAKQHGVLFVDAPVVGTAAPAERGELVVLASGPEGVSKRCQPVFEALGSKTMWVGEAGKGQLMKLVVNKWILDIFESLAESVAFAESLGVSPGDFLTALEDGPVGVPSARVRGEAMMAREFSHTSFSIDLAHKDAELILSAAKDAGCKLPATQVAELQLAEAVAMGLGPKDLAAVFLALPCHPEIAPRR